MKYVNKNNLNLIFYKIQFYYTCLNYLKYH